jgi:hypothetical protein
MKDLSTEPNSTVEDRSAVLPAPRSAIPGRMGYEGGHGREWKRYSECNLTQISLQEIVKNREATPIAYARSHFKASSQGRLHSSRRYSRNHGPKQSADHECSSPGLTNAPTSVLRGVWRRGSERGPCAETRRDGAGVSNCSLLSGNSGACGKTRLAMIGLTFHRFCLVFGNKHGLSPFLPAHVSVIPRRGYIGTVRAAGWENRRLS